MFNFRRLFLNHTHQHPLKFIHTIKNPLKDSTQDLNSSKFIGTVSSDVFCREVSETRIFYLRTFNPDNSYDSHKIIVTPYMIETLRGMPKIGQNLLIAGKIRTQQFLYKDKRRTSIQVIAKQMYVCDDRYEKFHVKTPNKVELLAHICFDVSNEETYSVFVLAVHYKSINTDGADVNRTDFVPVFVYNDKLRNIVRNQLKRLDRVRIEGNLRHKVCIDESGKKHYNGYIEATQIAKIISLRQILTQTEIFNQNEI